MSESTYASLRLTQLPHPAKPGHHVGVFSSWHKACEHIRDHLLTAPECCAWQLIKPGFAGGVNLDQADERWRCAQEVLKPNGGFAQGLYDRYCEAIGHALDDAARLKWHATDARVTVAMGTTGLLIVIDGLIRTAFLPGQGDPEALRAAGSSADAGAALPRQRGMRGGRRGEYVDRWSVPFEDRRRQFQERTRDEQVYYLVFRPAVQFIRARQNRCRDVTGDVLPGSDYALLKGVLPPMSRLKYQSWLAMHVNTSVVK